MIRAQNAETRPEQRRVPDCDIVEIGSAPGSASEPLDLHESDLARPVRRDTVIHLEQLRPARRDRTRLLTALLILEVGFLGVWYVGKRYAEAQVIVVPATGDPRFVITQLNG
jgi:hypothetical protein